MELLLKPDVLKWARERAGLSASSLALKLKTKPERVVAWETTGRLKFKEAEKLAQKTYTPFGCLYLSAPPIEKLPISDFRTVNDSEVFNPSPDLIETVDLAILRRDWFREYQITSGFDPIAYPLPSKI